jgi:hypothetical protein
VIVSSLTVGVVAGGARGPGGFSDRTLPAGSTYTITGQTAPLGAGVRRATGRVALSGRWDGGSSQLIARTTTSADGRYRLTIHLRRRGKLELRLTTPDHRTSRVVLTVV